MSPGTSRLFVQPCLIKHSSLPEGGSLIQELNNHTNSSLRNIPADPHVLGLFDLTKTSPLSVDLPSATTITVERQTSTDSLPTAQCSDSKGLSGTLNYEQKITDTPQAPAFKMRTLKPKSAAAQEREHQRWFKAHRQEMAEKWLQELDQTVTESKLSKITASTGGIPIHWSKKMITTAGHATINIAARTASVSLSDKIVIDEGEPLPTLLPNPSPPNPPLMLRRPPPQRPRPRVLPRRRLIPDPRCKDRPPARRLPRPGLLRLGPARRRCLSQPRHRRTALPLVSRDAQVCVGLRELRAAVPAPHGED